MKILSSRKFKYLFLLGLVFCLFSVFPQISSATTKYWVGADGAAFDAPNSWSSTNPTSCSGNVTLTATPGSSDDAVFDADCDNGMTIGSTWTVLSFQLYNGYTGVIEAGSSAINTGLFWQLSGTFNHNGILTITSGTNGCSTDTFYFSAGTFNQTGTVVFAGGAALCQVVNTSNTVLVLQNLTLNLSGGTTYSFKITDSDILQVNGLVTMSNGSYDTGTGLNGAIYAYGDVTMGSGWDGLSGPNNPIDSGILVLVGSNDQTLTAPSSNSSFGNVTVSKSGGTVTQSGGIRFEGLTLTSGTYNAGGNDVYARNAYYQVGGTFNHNGILTIAGGTCLGGYGFYYSAGTFNQTGTVNFTTNCNQITTTGTTLVLNNLTVNSPGAAITIKTGDTVRVNGLLSLTDGKYNRVAYWGPGGAQAGNLDAYGNVTMASTWDDTVASNAEGILRLQGTNNQTITGGGSAVYFGDVQVFKTAGTVTQSGTVGMRSFGVYSSGWTWEAGGNTFTQGGNNYGFNFGGGTFNSSGIINVYMFSMTGGTLNHSGALNVTQNFTYTAGTFNQTGTVVFKGTAQIIDTTNTTLNFYHLTINNTSIMVTNNDVVAVNGTLTLSNGSYPHDGNNGGSIYAYSHVTMEVGWDGTENHTGMIYIAGSNNQTITGNIKYFPRLSVVKTGGTITQSGDIYAVHFGLNGSGWTWNAGGNTITQKGVSWTNFNMTGGTFNHSGILNVAGDFTYSAGTFNQTGTVVFNGGVTQTINTTDTTLNFNRLTISKTGSTGLLITNNDYVAVNGTLNLSDGVFRYDGSNAGRIYAYSDVTMGAGWDETSSQSMGGSLWLMGSADQILTGQSSLWFPYLYISKTGGTVTQSGNINAYRPQIASGIYYANGYNITSTVALDVGSSGVLKLKGNETISQNPTLGTGSTVIYVDPTTNRSIKTWSYSNLTIAGGSNVVFSLGAAVSASGTTTITTGILSTGTSTVGYNFSTNTLVNNNILRLRGNEVITITNMDIDSGTVEYIGDMDGASDQLNLYGPADYYNFTINSTDAGDSFVPSFSSWTKQNSGNAVLGLGANNKFDDNQVLYHSVIYDSGTYKMWYSGYDGTAYYTIGYATSPDGITWTKQNSGNAVLGLGANGKFDDYYAFAPSVIKDGSTYKMWYSGYDGTAYYTIGYATSPDGITWTKQNSGNAVLGLGVNNKFDDASVVSPSVIKDGSTYKMWYAGSSGTNYTIGYATSPDGITWTRQNSGDAVLGLGASGKFDDVHLSYLKVILDGSTYKMLYSGYDGSTWFGLGYATSPDGLTWTKQNSGNPVFARDVSISQILSLSLLIDSNNNLRIWYGGNNGTAWTTYYALASSTPTGLIRLRGNLDFNSGSVDTSGIGLVLAGSNQSIDVNATTTFSTLTKSVTSPATLTFGTTSPIIITGTTTLNGTAGNFLSLRSAVASTTWKFDPQATTTGRVFSYLDVQDSYNINATAINATNSDLFIDSSRNTGWTFGATSNPILTVGRSGIQLATTTISAPSQDLGGAFTFVADTGTIEVNSITIRQVGSLSTDYITGMEFTYRDAVDDTCSDVQPASTEPFGSFNPFVDNVTTVSGSMPVSQTKVCLYLIYTLDGDSDLDTLGRTVDFEITNPSTDVLVESGTVTPISRVNIAGRTMVVDPNLAQSMLSLKMYDPDVDPTVFYLKDNGVWKKAGSRNPVRLTNPNLIVQTLTFTDLTYPGSSGSVKMNITVSNVSAGTADSFINVTKSYGTSATIRAKEE